MFDGEINSKYKQLAEILEDYIHEIHWLVYVRLMIEIEVYYNDGSLSSSRLWNDKASNFWIASR